MPIVDPTLLYGDRISRLDLRMSKVINYGRFRFQIHFDANNIANTSDVRSINSAYGSRWGYANSIIDARLLQIGGQIGF